MREFYEMINSYKEAAKRLAERRRQLAEEIKVEWDTDRLHLLEQRAALLDTEKYEILQDMRAIQSYVKERENAKKKSIA